MIGGGSSMSTKEFIHGLQNNPVMQVVAEQFAQYDVQAKGGAAHEKHSRTL